MSHTQHDQFSIAWVRLWISVYHLDLPLAIVHWKATVWKNYNFYWNLKKLYSTKNGCGYVCVPYATWLPVGLWRKVLSRDSLPIIAYIPLNWSIKQKSFGSRQECCMSNYLVVSHMQLFVPYVLVCLWYLYTEQSMN